MDILTLFIQKNGKVKEGRLCVHGSFHVSSQFNKDPLWVQQLQPLHEMLMEYSNSSIQMKLYCVPFNIFKIPLCLIKLWTSCIGLTIFVEVILLCYMLRLGTVYRLTQLFIIIQIMLELQMCQPKTKRSSSGQTFIKKTQIFLRFSTHKYHIYNEWQLISLTFPKLKKPFIFKNVFLCSVLN